MSTFFADTATIKVTAGRGGNGAVSFHREKYIAAGGPDGGDGGKGGDIIVIADNNMSTLAEFHRKRKYTAENGADGRNKCKSGPGGQDLVIKVPRGTLIRDKLTGGIIKDISSPEPFVLAVGGRGGAGNRHFATPVRQAPRFAKPGLQGQSFEVALELKLLADAGIIGFPNAGKSTFLSVVTKARPKTADYPFTTLTPNLGVVYEGDDYSFVLADIPGIIEGAAGGAGLGHDFLRHTDRCRLLIHITDVSGIEGRDPVGDFEIINAELKEYSPALASRPQIVAANKIDLLGDDREPIERLKKHVSDKGYDFYEISAATHHGCRRLTDAVAAKLKTLPPVTVYEPDYIPPEPAGGAAEDVVIEKQDDLWFVEGAWLDRLAGSVNFSDNESRMYFERMLRKAGITERMEQAGIDDGDSVSICGTEFIYKK
ncbi:MAG: GTPase ObgE [Oscillospiraceae bacterium]|nr:GTPase ObgE [Oscillospiraceae bacterium]